MGSRVLKEDSDYRILGDENGALELVYRGYKSSPDLDGGFGVGSALMGPDGAFIVVVVQPTKAFESNSVKQVAAVDTSAEALRILWEQRLHMNFGFSH